MMREIKGGQRVTGDYCVCVCEGVCKIRCVAVRAPYLLA